MLLSGGSVNVTVNLTKRGPDKKYRPVVESANGRIKPDWVLVNGEPTHMPEGSYYMSFYQGKRCIRKSVGRDAAQAQARRGKKQAELKLRAEGTKAGLTVTAPEEETSLRLAEVAADYLDEVSRRKDYKTFQAYSTAITYFQESCSKTLLSEITRDDLIRFADFLRDVKEQEPRSVHNKFSTVMGFLKNVGIKDLGVRASDRPKFVQPEVTVFEPEELEAIFAASTPEERLFFRFLLMTGFREGEAMHATWRDLSVATSTITVRAKPEYSWKPKANKERTVPIPAVLLEELLAVKPNEGGLIFPTTKGKPNNHMLRIIKAAADRAGVADAYLHKFRATYATTCLRNGVDVKTLQSWMGHSDLASTMRYLRAASGPSVRAKVDSIWAA
jgi:integrase/recombinase XerD